MFEDNDIESTRLTFNSTSSRQLPLTLYVDSYGHLGRERKISMREREIQVCLVLTGARRAMEGESCSRLTHS